MVLLRLLFVLPVLLRPSWAFVPVVGWQAHSFNDMNEWDSVFRKGADKLKIDPNFMPASFCATQQRANRTDPRGCFLLNHDNPVASRTDYNSTDDLLALLADKAFAARHWASPKALALCFKNGPADPCDGSAASAAWLSLVDEFFARAGATIAASQLPIELVLDGVLAPIFPCLYDRWQPWVSTYISGSNPAGAFTSNNATLGYNRFQILNEPTEWWPVAAAFKFGKFLNGSIPFQVWEPSDQPTILTMINDFVSAGLDFQPGMRFAINIDPAQFDVYAARLSQTAWNANVDPAASATDPRLALLADPTIPGVWVLVTVTRHSDPQNGLYFSANPASSLGRPAALADSADFFAPWPAFSPAVPLMPGSNWTTPLVNTGSLSVGPSNASFCLATATSAPGGFRVGCSWYTVQAGSGLPYLLLPGLQAFAAVAGNASSWDAVWVACEGGSVGAAGGCLVAAWSDASAPSSCAVQVQLWTDLRSEARASVCIAAPSNVQSFTVSSVHVSLASGPLGLEGVVSIGTAAQIVYAATLCGALDGSTLTVNPAPQTCSTPSVAGITARAIHVGSHPSVFTLSLPADSPFLPSATRSSTSSRARQALSSPASGQPTASGPGGVLVLEVHGDGFCPNAETFNKQPTPALCELAPWSLPNVLTYTLGPWTAWNERLSSASVDYFGPCDDSFQHGSLGMGAGAPSTLLFLWDTATLGIGVAHDALPANATDAVGCGIAQSGAGVFVDGWSIAASPGPFDPNPDAITKETRR